MAKRTRRNLSDPRIQRILKAYQQTSSASPAAFSGSNGWRRFLRGSLVAVFFLFLLVAAYYVLNSQGLHLLESGSGVQAMGQSGKVSPGGQPAKPGEPPVASEGQPTAQPKTARTEPQAPPPKPEPVPRGIQVQVLNGCGAPGVAAKVTRYLRQMHIDVVIRDNYRHFNVKETFILDRVGNPSRMKKIAQALGIPTSRIRLEKDQLLQVDATIVIGADFKSLNPFKNK